MKGQSRDKSKEGYHFRPNFIHSSIQSQQVFSTDQSVLKFPDDSHHLKIMAKRLTDNTFRIPACAGMT